jgi:glutathione synthase/RimK-type ligase-like ATP-grasp enzyme
MENNKTVLILCTAGDIHVYAVAEALQKKGATVLLWFASDFPTISNETVTFGPEGMTLSLGGPEIQAVNPRVDTVWNRRIGFNTDFSAVHPSDQAFVYLQRQRFREGILRTVLKDALWVNPWDAALQAENKLFQHSIARTAGLRTPDSIYTNDPSAIRQFMRDHSGRIVYKTFGGLGWSDGEKSWACHTVALSEGDLVEDALLRAAPGIYQEILPKDHELRVTMIGDQPYAVKILSQETSRGKLDWRLAYDEIKMEAVELSPGLRRCCSGLLKSLNLVFGCLDFVVTPQGEHVFLEVNQQGQFLFVEQYSRLPLLDAFSDFLLHKEPSALSQQGALHFYEVSAEAEQRAAASRSTHYWAELIQVNEKP